MRQPALSEPAVLARIQPPRQRPGLGPAARIIRGALADTRGARGRARAVRDAARSGAEISEAVLAGLTPLHSQQIELFPDSLTGKVAR